MSECKELRISDVFIRLFMWVYGLAVLLPVLWVVVTSFKTNQEFVQSPWGFFQSPQFVNYVNAWRKVNFSVYTVNSLAITASVVIVSSLLACCAAYVLVRMRFKFSGQILAFFIAGLYIPIVLILPSEFLLLESLKLGDNRVGLMLVYIAFSLPYSILVMSGFLSGIPRDLEEAAYIDGAGLNRTFWSIIMPLSKNGLITMAIFNLLWVWNDFIVALTFIQTDAKRTLPVGIISLIATFKLRADWVTLFAGLNMVMIPTVIVYVIFQKSLQEGLTMGAVKG